MKILVTGGAGYIGSHTCVELLQEDHQVVVVDNLSNSKETSLQRVQEITGKSLTFYKADLLNEPAIRDIFKREAFEAVIHFAGLKAVGESVAIPLDYYYNNVSGTLVLCRVMKQFSVHNLVFSSSATVYGAPDQMPIREDFPLNSINPYGRSKLMIEQILSDLQTAHPEWNVALLRYFNPVGAHSSGKIGEDPNGIPNNLLPYVAQVAVGRQPFVRVFGGDYPTPDGTGIRDYIHVTDLAIGHLRALDKLFQNSGLVIYNLGTGLGTSVLEVIDAFIRACGKQIPYQIMDRRPGDAAISYADPSKANHEMNWYASRSIDEMCADTWRWQSFNPHGYLD
jgi:UDP-glucose 4-epimerase